MTGLIATSFPKAPGSLVGFFTDLDISNCEEGSTFTMLNLPWHITYSSFSGELPNIDRIQIVVNDVALLARIVGLVGTVECLYSGDVRMRIDPVVTSFTSIDFDGVPILFLVRQLESRNPFVRCPATVSLASRAFLLDAWHEVELED